MEINLKKLIFIPIILLAFTVLILVLNKINTGDFIIKDVDLKGGTLITIETDSSVDTKLLETNLNERYGSAFVSGLRTATGFGANIEVSSEVNSTAVLEDVRNFGVDIKSYSIETIGPALGEFFFQQMIYILIVAFVLMSAVIFVIYRNAIPSFGIVFASLANILTTIAIANLIGIEISFAGFAGLLMLIAYTVDTNIVLTTKVLAAGTEDFNNRYRRALRTGLTLIATIAITMILIPFLSTSKLLINIAQILVIGFISDLPYTWIFNSAILKMWHERRFKLIS